MKKTCPNAFSLMEMMIVLLIVAIIAAATAPMVTKKMTRHANPGGGAGESLWEPISSGSNIIRPTKDYNGIQIYTNDNNPNAITIMHNNDSVGVFRFDKKNNFVISNGVTVESRIETTDPGEEVELGGKPLPKETETTESTNNIIIGYSENGSSTKLSGAYNNVIIRPIVSNYYPLHDTIAIGHGATISNNGEINIGNKFKYNPHDQHKLTLGNDYDYVYIPGKLVVGGSVVLGANESTVADGYFGEPAVFLRESGGNHDLVAFNKAPGNGSSYENIFKSFDESHHLSIGGITYTSLPSDIRLKNVGEKFEAGLEELKKLDFFNYTFKDDVNKTPRVGVMAQDLQKVFPNAVTEGEDGYLKIRMEDMFYAVINAVKELDTRLNILVGQVKMYFDKVDSLEAKVEAQQQEIEALKAQNAEFEERLAKLEKRRK